MSLDNVKKEILAQAEKRAEEIVSQAKEQVKQISSEAEQELTEYQKKATAQNKKLLERTERKMLASARFDAQRLVMNTKKEAIETILNNVNDQIKKLSEKERKDFLQNLLAKAKTEIDVTTVSVSPADKKLVSGIDTDVIDINGGLIAHNIDDTISINLSVEELLENVRNEMLVEISASLFDTQKGTK